ncbi:MAG: hypothetical protein ACW99F_20035 [Candidatus Hodarchaeales archaeon]
MNKIPPNQISLFMELRKEQLRLKRSIQERNNVNNSEIRLIAGVDVSYSKDKALDSLSLNIQN